MQKKLSIAVVTMNRAQQLKEALMSCLSCKLPQETEFVIIDNASVDDTEDVVNCVLGDCGYEYIYERMAENLGVGGGRNRAFSKSRGEYVYSLDDDAVIATEDSDFFVRAVSILDVTPEIVTLTTQIYDIAWGMNRLECCGRGIQNGMFTCKTFCGGSHFLRKSFFENVPYLPNKYGYEEVPPSLRVVDAGLINAFCPSLLVIHKPAVDKWDFSDKKNYGLLINECAVPYAIKKMMYPKVVMPLVYMAYVLRKKKHLESIPDAEEQCSRIVQETIEKYYIGYRVKLKTIWRLFNEFGISIL